MTSSTLPEDRTNSSRNSPDCALSQLAQDLPAKAGTSAEARELPACGSGGGRPASPAPSASTFRPGECVYYRTRKTLRQAVVVGRCFIEAPEFVEIYRNGRRAWISRAALIERAEGEKIKADRRRERRRESTRRSRRLTAARDQALNRAREWARSRGLPAESGFVLQTAALCLPQSWHAQLPPPRNFVPGVRIVSLATGAAFVARHGDSKKGAAEWAQVA